MSNITSLQIGQNKIELAKFPDWSNPTSIPYQDAVNGFTLPYDCWIIGTCIATGSGSSSKWGKIYMNDNKIISTFNHYENYENVRILAKKVIFLELNRLVLKIIHLI